MITDNNQVVPDNCEGNHRQWKGTGNHPQLQGTVISNHRQLQGTGNHRQFKSTDYSRGTSLADALYAKWILMTWYEMTGAGTGTDNTDNNNRFIASSFAWRQQKQTQN